MAKKNERVTTLLQRLDFDAETAQTYELSLAQP